VTAPAVRSVKPFTRQEALFYLLGIHCPSCGAVLDRPGDPCGACGKIPEVTGPQAEEHLSSATAIALVQERVLDAEAEALFQRAVDKWQDAAQVVLVAQLTDARDKAKAVYDAHQARHEDLVAARAGKEAAEAAAAAVLTAQAEPVKDLVHQAEIAASMNQGAVAVARAKQLVALAEEELKPYRTALAGAAGEHDEAGRAVTRSEQWRDQLRKALDDAEDRLQNPGVAPLGTDAIIASPYRMLAEDRLDDEGIELAAEIGRGICDLTGRTGEIEADARARLLSERESEFRNRPVLLDRQTGVAHPNPLHARTPQPFHPPSALPAGATTSGVVPAGPGQGGFTG
jgi:uncharacterized Zn finger protein (UPF0148 family)